MIKIKYSADGKEISEKDFFARLSSDNIRQWGLSIIANKIAERIKDISCPEHGEYATITFLGMEGTQMQFNFSACCKEFIATCTEKVYAGYSTLLF